MNIIKKALRERLPGISVFLECVHTLNLNSQADICAFGRSQAHTL